MKPRKSHIFITFPIFFTLVFLPACTKKEALPSRTEMIFGTVCTINLFESGTEQLYGTLFARLRALEDTLSANIGTSEISRINDAAGQNPVQVSAETLFVLTEAEKYARLTGGAFDPTIGPLVKLWDIGGDHPHLPTQAEIDAVLPLINYEDMVIDSAAGTVFLKKAGMKLDVGGIAKGYAADEMVRIMREQNVPRALIDLGGNIYALGDKAKGTPWRIGIKDPFNPLSGPAVRLDVTDKTVVTSGVYERFFDRGGVHYHHIFDPQTGYPVWNQLMSATVITPSSTAADALSTALFVMGHEKGIPFAETLPDIEAVFITEAHDIYATPGIRPDMTILAEEFELID